MLCCLNPPAGALKPMVIGCVGKVSLLKMLTPLAVLNRSGLCFAFGRDPTALPWMPLQGSTGSGTGALLRNEHWEHTPCRVMYS